MILCYYTKEGTQNTDMKALAFQEILNSPLLQATIKKYIGDENPDIVHRPACYILRNRVEDKQICKRIIVLAPHGYTADSPELMNPHPEAYKARVRVLGALDPTKKGYKPTIQTVELHYANNDNIPTQKTSAYAEYSSNYGGSKYLPWKNWVYVVKKNRWGDFHNIINKSDEWVVSVVEKWLVDQKKIDITPYLNKLSPQDAETLKKNLQIIRREGDEVFENKSVMHDVLQVSPEILIPILIQMLNVSETGRHESCTFFAFLLKIARHNKELVEKETKRAIERDLAPYYYLEDLEKKLRI